MAGPEAGKRGVSSISSELYVRKTKETRQITRRKARLLLAEDTAQRQQAARQQEIAQLEAEKATLDKEVSRKEQPIDQQMMRMGTTHKTLMDAIKICARNLFYQALAPFKKLDDNRRDDHVRFREVTRFDGVLRHDAAGMEVHLVTHMHLAPKQLSHHQRSARHHQCQRPPDARRQRPQDGIAIDR